MLLIMWHANDNVACSDSIRKLKNAEEHSRVELALTDGNCLAVVT